ncbi:DUF6617 family protein [Polluticoccus soli]|uniref:DUF6617 family protein n=1 Tax=Polluticoccus soli TaxID=3034150 RepID=UPI0023E0C503|nr:DUF6617 family protein [Flavipsychrobacter sp. JY13-12]
MGKVLLYSDIQALVADISKQPDAAIICDFVNYWRVEYEKVLGDGFLYYLKREINKKEAQNVSEDDLGNWGELELSDYSKNNNTPQLLFAATYIEYLIITEVEGYLFSEFEFTPNEPASLTSLPVDNNVGRFQTISFRLAEKNKTYLEQVLEQLTATVDFLEDKAKIDQLVKIFLEKDVADINREIQVGCNTQTAAYILYKLKDAFGVNLKGTVKVFRTKQQGRALTDTNLRKSHHKSLHKDFSDKKTIDQIFNELKGKMSKKSNSVTL